MRLREACAAAVEELQTSRTMIDALEIENASLNTRLETEKRLTAIQSELITTHTSEADALRTALAAKNETIAAKDLVIASQDRLAETLKKQRQSPLKRIGDILIGVAAGIILK
ncbi:MAG: hypothetical protein WKF34_08790 [Pyrinomonadaceae bacterium]